MVESGWLLLLERLELWMLGMLETGSYFLGWQLGWLVVRLVVPAQLLRYS